MDNENSRFLWFETQNVHINKEGVDARVKFLQYHFKVSEKENFAAWLLKVISLIDLTTLAGDDTEANVHRLCLKALQPLPNKLFEKLGFKDCNGNVPAVITTAAVCVYPSKVPDVVKLLKALKVEDKIQIAAVATGFPSGLYRLESRLLEIRDAVASGATEIDVVIDRSLALSGRWRQLYDQLLEMKVACGTAHIKVILGVGELATYANVYKASMVAMCAGADFIKTSTGKEAVNATLQTGLVMCRAIRDYYTHTGRRVGLKPAGGIKTPAEAVQWLILVKEELGEDWLRPELFRIGASSLLGGVQAWLHEYATGELVDPARFAFI